MESLEHASLKEGLKQAFEAIGYKAVIEKRIGIYEADVWIQNAEGKEIVFEVEVHKKLSEKRKIALEALGIKVVRIDAHEKVKEEREEQIRKFKSALILYSEGKGLSEISKITKVNRKKVETWVRENGAPNLVGKEAANLIRKQLAPNQPSP